VEFTVGTEQSHRLLARAPMTSSPMPFSRCSVLLVIVLLSSACGGDPKPTQSAPVQSQPGPQPLDAAAGSGLQEAIQACMRSRGFQYIPVANQGGFSGGVISDAEERWFRESFGYGVSIDPSIAREDKPVDPNQAVIESLSEVERDAYFLALNGFNLIGEAAPASAKPCVEVAAAETGNLQAEMVNLSSRIAVLSTRANSGSLIDAITQTPEFLEALDVYIACMTEAGFEDAGRTGGEEWIRDQAADLGLRLDTDPIPDEGDQPNALPASSLSALQTLEIATALADWDCSQTSREMTAELLYGTASDLGAGDSDN